MGRARREGFRGASDKMPLAAETGENIWLEVASETQGLYWPQTLSVLARNLSSASPACSPQCRLCLLRSEDGSQELLVPIQQAWENPTVPALQGAQDPASPALRSRVRLWLHDWQEGCRSCWLLLGSQISLSFLGCTGEWWRPKQKSEHCLEGDKWKECWMGNQWYPGERTYPRTLYPSPPRLFQVHSENQQDVLWNKHRRCVF